jgi:hypothetical protein
VSRAGELTQQVGRKPDSVTCPDKLEGTGISVSVTDVDAGDINFDFKVDDQPTP